MDVVEWSRALDVRLREWCCSVSMVWVQIPSREEQNLTALKSKKSSSLEMPVPSQGHYGFHSFQVVD